MGVCGWIEREVATISRAPDVCKWPARTFAIVISKSVAHLFVLRFSLHEGACFDLIINPIVGSSLPPPPLIQSNFVLKRIYNANKLTKEDKCVCVCVCACLGFTLSPLLIIDS